MTGGEAAAEAYLTAQFPWLADPAAQDLLDWIVTYIGGALQTVMINGATGIVINIQTTAENSEVMAAATALQIAQESGNAAAVQSAMATALAAYKNLFNWDGTFSAPAS